MFLVCYIQKFRSQFILLVFVDPMFIISPKVPSVISLSMLRCFLVMNPVEQSQNLEKV